MTNPGFKETDASYPAALEIRCNNVIDWCEIARERLSLGERIGFGQVGVMFHGQLSLETGNTTDCIVKVTKGNSCIFTFQVMQKKKTSPGKG